jgi:hypothetical protein
MFDLPSVTDNGILRRPARCVDGRLSQEVSSEETGGQQKKSRRDEEIVPVRGEKPLVGRKNYRGVEPKSPNRAGGRDTPSSVVYGAIPPCYTPIVKAKGAYVQ